MHLVETTRAQRAFAAAVADILRSADALNDEAASATLELIGALQRQIEQAMGRAAVSAFDARHLDAIRTALASAAARFVADYSERYPELARKAWDLGIALADVPLATAGLDVATSVVPRSTLETLTRYSADLIKGLARDAVSKVNTVIAQATLGTITPTDAIGMISGQLPGRSVFASISARAETIARTEIGRVLSVAHEARFQQQARDLPGLGKAWVTAGDSSVRETHAELEGVVIASDEFFSVGGYEARYPRDPSLPAEESANCRCWATPVLPEEMG